MIDKNKNLIIYSSRVGGPYNQHHLLYEYLCSNNFNVRHWVGLWSWIKLHFFYGKNNLILTNVPLLFRFKKKNYFFNIKGNFNIEKGLLNPLGYLYSINVNWAEQVIVPSEYLKKKLQIDDALVIFNSMRKNKIIKKNIKKDGDRIRLICVTMFAFKLKAEGVLKILKSLSLLKTNKIVELDIYGDGKFRDEIMKLSKLISMPKGISYNFKGFSKDIVNKLSMADIFLYWSDLDSTLPSSVLEAMGFGLPIVSNDFESFVGELSENNLVSHSVNEFTENVSFLIKNEDTRKHIGKKNLNFYKSRTTDKNFKEWINLLYKD